MRVAVEVCVTSLEEAMTAERCGADSVELCTWLACGGVTPSIGLIRGIVEHVAIPVRVLVRPTPGGFRYSEEEKQIMLGDLEALSKTAGVHRVVIGALDDTGLPDQECAQEALRRVTGLETTFHRAIDRSTDLQLAFERCVALGFQRILTSGGASLANDGATHIARMVRYAPPGMCIAAAGGINADNVLQLVERTGVQEIHFAAQRAVEGQQERVALSSANASTSFVTRPDSGKIDGVLAVLSKAGLR